ncbi:c-type cytochrome [Opitutales bacterium]|nr:c-type cytochrome [Opitutales bacterium]
MKKPLNKLKVLSLTILPALLFFAGGCSRIDHKQSALDPKGLVSQNQYDIFMLSVWITIFLFCAVGGCLLYVLWKYRAKTPEEAMEVPPQSHGNSKVEVSLIIASTVILVILAIPTLQGVVLMNRVPDPNDAQTLEKLNLNRSAIDNAITVNVTGKRFFWVFEYPQYGIVTANELVFPTSRAVRINLRTEDVIHSFWLPKLAGKMDLMPGQENFLWFIADQEKILSGKDADGKEVKYSIEDAMPPVFNGKMRERIFTKQKFTDEFEAVGGLFYGQCAEYCGNSHAYMSFRALAQTDKDFDAWVNKFQVAQNPNLQPSAYNPENEYSKGSLVTFSDKSLGESATREFRATKEVAKGEAPNLSKKIWTQANPDDYERGKQLFSSLQCVQCHAINRTGLGSKGPNLTLFGIRTSLAAGWMRNDEENLDKWLRNSNDVKFGNLMWNGEGVDDNHPLRNLEDEDQKVKQLVTYLLGLK